MKPLYHGNRVNSPGSPEGAEPNPSLPRVGLALRHNGLCLLDVNPYINATEISDALDATRELRTRIPLENS
jgi:hypothetical protein